MTVKDFELGATADDIGRKMKIIKCSGDYDIKVGHIVKVQNFKDDGVAFCIYKNLNTGTKNLSLFEDVVLQLQYE